MTVNARFVLLAVAVILFLFAAGEAAGWINYGNAAVVQNIGLAAFAGAFIPPVR